MPKHLVCPNGHGWDLMPDAEGRCPVCGLDTTFPSSVHSSPSLHGPPVEELPGTPPAYKPDIPGYEVVQEIARGAAGIVYLAWGERQGAYVAVKVVRLGIEASSKELLRFRREAEVTSRLDHPNIVRVFEVGEYDGLPYIALEYVDGGTLAQQVADQAWPAPLAARLTAILARAVDAAHRNGVIHRDLKSSNVLMTADGVPKLADFGLAKLLGREGATRPGAILGTADYMSPEQASGQSASVGPAADVYSLGSILYHLLVGRPPFTGAKPMNVVMKVLSEIPPPPSALCPGLSSNLEAICLRCLAKEPGRRYQSALELAIALAPHFGG